MLKKTFLATVILTTLSACSTNSMDQAAQTQGVVDLLASNLDINYEVITNQGVDDGLPCKTLQAEWASCNKIHMTLKNTGETVDSQDWSIYFHSVRLILDSENEQFKVTRLTGDLHKLEPTDKFTGFAQDEEIVIPMIGEYWQLFETDFFPRAFVTAPGAEAKNIVSLDTEETSQYIDELTGNKLKRTLSDNNVFATAATRFAKNADVVEKEVSAHIIPTPVKTTLTNGTADLSQGIRITASGLDAGQIEALNQRAELLGLATSGDYPIQVEVDQSKFTDGVSGAYQLQVEQGKTSVIAFDQAGAFYGVQSLLALVNLAETKIPTVKIEDQPRFEYRGVMVDVARNFHSKAAMLATLDQMAAYKLNKLHLHLTDDEGWRLQIPDLPELTDIGGQRCFDESETQCLLPQLGSGANTDNFGSGYFTTEDYVEILTYAKHRNIEVIPEIDMPAHSRAAVMSMEARYLRLANEGKLEEANQYRLMDPLDESNVTTVQFYNKQSFINPCLESSTTFVDKVITEVAAMHKAAGVPLTTWQFGGDEAKNIKLHAGFQDINDEEKIAWKGDLDLAKQDAPFAKSPACQTVIASGEVADFDHLPSYFAEEVSKVVAKHGIANFQAWQDGLKYSENSDSFATENVRVNFWDVLYWGGTASGYELANQGYDVILSNPDYVYMDMPYEIDPKERGYYWATRATDTRKMFGFAPENLPQNAETSLDRDGNGFTGEGTVESKPFYGLSAQLWSETVRTDEQYEYMVFPRVLAAAERAWHKASWENDYKVGVQYSQESNLVDKEAHLADWTNFANAMGQRELAKLERAGIDYRLPVPGAKVANGLLSMNASFPGVGLQYSLDDGKTWLDYDNAAKPSVAGNVQLRSISETGKRASRVISIN
ncbi:beta-N-acetylhexosaminidase [Vibrio sp. 10N.286.49.B3]|uniref:beta-N-acetylhexosaminidase n=1 Tax=Vibrio sp. 10N.286.49.B3 TaxID=1880855 RepID=UPI000C822FCF|nr:beta-N-acetylhexosaminidase [Vibrio sp. 10N.286.49.B3]PMH44509.1 beta-N-acetylhexosaminidase [Vibrio sp. 10N.286.49.B3]